MFFLEESFFSQGFLNFFKRIIFNESRLCLEDFLLTALSVLAISSKTTEVFLIELLVCCICVTLCCNTLILKDFLNLENVAADVTSWSSCWLLAWWGNAESFKHQRFGKYRRRNFWKLCWNWREKLKRGPLAIKAPWEFSLHFCSCKCKSRDSKELNFLQVEQGKRWGRQEYPQSVPKFRLLKEERKVPSLCRIPTPWWLPWNDYQNILDGWEKLWKVLA